MTHINTYKSKRVYTKKEFLINVKNSCILETPNLLTDADSITDTFFFFAGVAKEAHSILKKMAPPLLFSLPLSSPPPISFSQKKNFFKCVFKKKIIKYVKTAGLKAIGAF